MQIIYHYNICPFSRKVRIALAEKNISFQLKVEKFWEKRKDFLKLNPAGTIPIFLSRPNIKIVGSQNIIDFFEEIHSSEKLIYGSPLEKAEVRRMINWFDEKFYPEASKIILEEKIFNFLDKKLAPNQSKIKKASSNLSFHLSYIQHLLSRNQWLCGSKITLADLNAAAHISSLDYLGEIKWSEYELIKEWYSVIKSRPSFREILNDKVTGFPPVKHYSELDF